jgi:hypothetical protein
MRRHLVSPSLWLGLLVVSGSLACSGNNNHPDAGPVDAGDPAQIFGLFLNNCFEYSSSETASVPPSLGASVEDDQATTVEYFGDGGYAQLPALKFVYRVNGLDKMEDYLRIENRKLYLLKRTVTGAETVEYKPAALLAELPFKDGDEFESDGGSERECTQNGCSDFVGYDLVGDVVSDSPTTPAGPQTGFAIAYTETPTHYRLTRWTFAVGTGPVVVEGAMDGNTLVDGGSVSTTYKLQSTRTVTSAAVPCGTSQP